MNRRSIMLSGAAFAAVAAYGIIPRKAQSRAQAETKPDVEFEITKTPEEWKEILTPDQFAVLREHGTERPYTSPLNDVTAEGVYHCAGCDYALYPSETKYDSRTGWPSFWEEIEGRIGTTVDYKLIYPRTEVHCARCGGHLGHIFDDGPQPTGKRHCLNGLSLTFKPADAGEAEDKKAT